MESRINGPSKQLVSDYKASKNPFIERHFDNIVKDFQGFTSQISSDVSQREYDIQFVCFMDGNLNALDITSEFHKGLQL